MKARTVPSDLLANVGEAGAGCPRCGATTHLEDGTCLNCLLKEGLEAHRQASSQVFESVLSEADVPDTHWRLGNYEILEEIGRGGMGVIYRAQQRHSRRIVALKRVIAYQSDSHETLVRFQREAEAAASLDHSNILPIYEVSESEDGLPFFSMKYATGGNLRAAIPALHSAPNECVRLMAKIVRAIAYAHDHGILHRDLQPGNILLNENGEPMVSDFGLAKWLGETSDLTRTLTTFGTPGYIAPEQAEDAAGNITPAADIYSLGAILFHLLTGRPPFVGTNVLSVIHQAAAAPAPRLRSLTPSLDRDLETILARALERDPKARYQTAGALAEDLERWLEGRPILARRVLVPARMWRWARRNPVLASAAATCLLLGVTVIWLLHGQVANPPALPPPEKSIAVLPFENLSDNKDHSDFGAGIQEELLTSLAQIHELRVISRTSVMAYQKPVARNVRDIGRALSVANVLEGSVRRAGNRVLVNVQLIDARNDRHLWAERYDRTLADSIGLQGELATQIAAALKATLAPGEKARLDTRPTTNSEAYMLYLTALGREGGINYSTEDEIAAEQLFMQATTLDPGFALAYAQASIVNSVLATGMTSDHRMRKAKARAQADEALRLSPTLGEVHMALGLCLYYGEEKYDAALKEFEVAAATLPNNAKICSYIAGIYRRQGRWRESVAGFERALSLAPRDRGIAFQVGNNHLWVRDWPAAAACYNLALEIRPDFLDPKIGLAYLEVFQNSNPAAGSKILQNIPNGILPFAMVTSARWHLAMLERDYGTAEKIVTDSTLDDFPDAPKTFYQGCVALARGDIELAQRYFAAATPEIEKRVREDPGVAKRHARLGLLYAYMQRKEDAIRESRRAIELEPESKNAFHGPLWAANLALVYALVGEPDQAITLIERLLSTPGAASYPDVPNSITLAELRLRWEWDSLRSNPRFQKILAGPEPKTNLTSIAPATPAPSQKSIAVLPFENLSDDKQNAYFAAGIQEDVLTSLAQIHELKVISRTSVMAYQKAEGRNIREIAQALGVANILEGSVRREGNRVLVNVQLIDARNDRHLWAQRYDRTVADSIGLQGELATQIAAALKTTLAPEEMARFAAKPTANSEAYVLYLTALGKEATDWSEAEQLYVQATTVDPTFALAYARASLLNSWYASSSNDRERTAKARAQAEEALRLAPTLGEAHMALALCLYLADKKYDAALKEFELAAAASPNNAKIHDYVAGIYRRQGRWPEAVASFERALFLDPRNASITNFAGNNYLYVRDWAAAAACYNHALEIKPDSVHAKIGLACLEVFRNANPAAGRRILQNIPASLDSDGDVALTRWDMAMLERDYATAEKIVSDLPLEVFKTSFTPKTYYQGRTALARGDKESAERYFVATIPALEKWVRDEPDSSERHALIGLLYAYLHRNEDAIREARQAVEVEPESEDAFHGAMMAANLAMVYALVGEQDTAIALIERLLSAPGPFPGPGTEFPSDITLADLRLRWEWDSLRSNPRFKKIVAGPEPQTNLTTTTETKPR